MKKQNIEVRDSGLVIEAKDIVKTFYIGEPNELEILHGMSFNVPRGQFVSIVGQSGSGKSTLMNIIGALDRPTSGEYYLDGIDISQTKDKQLSEIRNNKIGFVFQTFNLVARTSALKNVELPLLYAGYSSSERRRRAKELLETVDMAERAGHMPNELSGGQKQRVAIARAMANDPSLILADEPTGALDSRTGRMVMDLFHKLHEEQGKTIVLITHNNELAAETDRIITISDGNIISDSDISSRDAAPPELFRPAPVPVNTEGIIDTSAKAPADGGTAQTQTAAQAAQAPQTPAEDAAPKAPVNEKGDE
ncbi:MAG: ABC transporter ATP-binding protein [Oscillospiraceae bacterium]|nr:ABC transporter ATP-binding protein [Oscillospiraceae bacterium]